MRRLFMLSALSVLAASLTVLAAPAAHAVGDGTVSTLVGTGALDGPAYDAVLSASDAATAVDGTVYVADPARHRIRALATDATISTFAGSVRGYADGPLADALFDRPQQVVVTGDGTLYVADTGNRRVRRISGGTVTTVAGNGSEGAAVAAADATTQPVQPSDVAWDAANDRLLVVDNLAHRLWAVTASGALEVVAGTGFASSSTDGLALQNPRAVALGPDGAIYVAGADVRRIAAGVMTKVAGGGADTPLDSVLATAAFIPTISSIGVGNDGTVYVADAGGGGANRGLVRTFTVGGALGSVADAPCANVAEVDLVGGLLAACSRTLWRRALGSWAVVAGQDTPWPPVPDGTPVEDVGFGAFGANGLTKSGDDYVIRYGHAIYRITDGKVYRVAGTGTSGSGAADGTTATSANVNPCGIAALADGTVVFTEGGTVRTVADGVLGTLLGGPSTTGTFTDGMAASSFAFPYCPAMTAEPGGDLYLRHIGAVYRLDVSGGTLHHVVDDPCDWLIGQPTQLAATGTEIVLGYTWTFGQSHRHAVCRYDLGTGTAGAVHHGYDRLDALAAYPDGRVVIATSETFPTYQGTRLRELRPGGSVTTIAGPDGADRAAGTTLAEVEVAVPSALYADPDGSLLWQEQTYGLIRRAAPGWSVDPVDPVTALDVAVTFGTPNSVTLTWTVPQTPYQRLRVEAWRSDQPYDPATARAEWVAAGGTTTTFTNLDLAQPWVFSVRPVRDGDEEWAPRATTTELTPAYAAPEAAPGVYAFSGGTFAAFVWTPTGAPETEVRIAPGTTPPATPQDGTRAYRGTAAGTFVRDLTPGQQYAVSVFALDGEGNAAAPLYTRTFEGGWAPKATIVSGPPQDGWVRGTTTVTWTKDGNATSVACWIDGKAVACGDGSFTLSGLSGGGHTMSVEPIGPFGTGRGSGASFYSDSVAPSVYTADLPPITLATSATTTYTSGDGTSGIASYDTRYRRAPYSADFGAWAYPATWQGVTVKSRTLTGLRPGYTYCFSTRARDNAGNVGAWSVEQCTAAVLDDRSLSASSGWSRATSGSYHLGTYTGTTRLGATLTRTGVRAGRVAVVATTCPTCGTVGVYLNGTLLKKVSLVSSTTKYRVVLPLSWLGVRTGTITLKVLTSGKPVRVDGLALSSR